MSRHQVRLRDWYMEWSTKLDSSQIVLVSRCDPLPVCLNHTRTYNDMKLTPLLFKQTHPLPPSSSSQPPDYYFVAENIIYPISINRMYHSGNRIWTSAGEAPRLGWLVVPLCVVEPCVKNCQNSRVCLKSFYCIPLAIATYDGNNVVGFVTPSTIYLRCSNDGVACLQLTTSPASWWRLSTHSAIPSYVLSSVEMFKVEAEYKVLLCTSTSR